MAWGAAGVGPKGDTASGSPDESVVVDVTNQALEEGMRALIPADGNQNITVKVVDYPESKNDAEQRLLNVQTTLTEGI